MQRLEDADGGKSDGWTADIAWDWARARRRLRTAATSTNPRKTVEETVPSSARASSTRQSPEAGAVVRRRERARWKSLCA